jgi:NADPH:quinone reductase-like Zn-dependent oxidoreductase
MRGFVLSRYGGPEYTALTDVPQPAPRVGEVLVRVHAAGLNPVDFKIRAGALKIIHNYPLPIVMGNELSGVVEAVGPGVTRFAKGERVFARVAKESMGAFAEYAVVNEEHAARMPASLDFPPAAAVPLAALTALQALRDELHLSAGQRVFIPGGAGGSRYLRDPDRQAPGRPRRDDGFSARGGARQTARCRRGDRLLA